MEPFTSNFRIIIFNFQALKFTSGKHIEDMHERDIKQQEGNKLTDLIYPTSLNFEESLYQLEFDLNDMKLYNALQSSLLESFHYMERGARSTPSSITSPLGVTWMSTRGGSMVRCQSRAYLLGLLQVHQSFILYKLRKLYTVQIETQNQFLSKRTEKEQKWHIVSKKWALREANLGSFSGCQESVLFSFPDPSYALPFLPKPASSHVFIDSEDVIEVVLGVSVLATISISTECYGRIYRRHRPVAGDPIPTRELRREGVRRF
ncbi:unnamed protein product [Fraxinus pennsylvanica]|uniref:Uncharacterized protein n=1 Tax=Fraxinus pennsylvanica TaxID=56036 RepID=A0AAD1Z4W8_9LAMI|nr:unnamed protein product [Fraxinus pennsylvanica]